MKEIEYMDIGKCNINGSQISGLSCNNVGNTLLVAFSDFTAEYSKRGQFLQILQKHSKGFYSCIMSAHPCYVTIRACEEVQYLNIYSKQGQTLRSYSLSNDYKIEDIVFNPSSDPGEDSVILIMLARDQRQCPCILKCKIDFCGIRLCRWNQKCCDYYCGCDGNCCCGDSWNCSKNCCCENCCGCCNENCCLYHNCSEAACDVLESIALTEAALAHILNAEGEKIQKAVKIAESVCELLEIDKSVNKTITNVTFLEQTLYAKMEALVNLNFDNCHPNNEN